MNWQTGMAGSIAAGIGGTAGSAIMGALTRSLTGMDSLIGRTLTTPFVAAIGAMGAAIAALTLASRAANAEFTRLGRAMADLHGATGIGAGASGNIVNRFGAFGLNAGSMLGGQNAMQMAMTARMFGLPGQGSANFIPALASQFQGMSASGPMGHMMARGRLEALGMDTPEMRRVLTSPLDSLNRQAAFQSKVQGGLGVDPEMIARVTQQFDLMNARLTTLGSGILVRIASETLPRLNNSLEQFSNYLANNAEQIGTAISGGINAGFDAAKRFGLFMYADFPVMLNSASLSVVEFAMRVVETVPAIDEAFTRMLGNIGPLFESGWAAIAKGATVAFSGILGALDRVSAHPMVAMAMRAAPALDAVSRATAPISAAGERVGNAIIPGEGQSPWAALLGLATVPLGFGLGKMGVGMIGRAMAARAAAGAAAAGAGAAGGAAATGGLGALLGPVGIVGGVAAAMTAAGTYGILEPLYNSAQNMGILNRGRGFYSSLQRGIGMTADYLTGNYGHYDRAAAEYEQREAARRSMVSGGLATAGAYASSLAGGFAMPDFSGMGGGASFNVGRGGGGSLAAGLQRLHDSLTQQGKELGTSGERRAAMEALLARIASNTGATANNTAETVKSMGCMESRILREAEDNAVADAVQGVLGISGSGGY